MDQYNVAFQRFLQSSNQTRTVAAAIAGLDMPFTYVDVGSGNGLLTIQVLQIMEGRYRPVNLYALEPNREAFEGLKERLGNRPNSVLNKVGFMTCLNKYCRTLEVHLNLV